MLRNDFVRSTILSLAIGLILATVPATSAQAASMPFAPDRDTILLGGTLFSTDYTSANFGHSVPLDIGGAMGVDERSIMSFNVAGLGSKPVQVNSITLVLTATAGSPGVDLHPEVHAITEANQGWVQGTGGGSGLQPPADNGMASWNAAKQGSVNWVGGAGLSTAGTAYDSTVLSSLTLTAGSYSSGATLNFAFGGTSADLTALVNSWLADNIGLSRPNPGLLLFDPTAASMSPSSFARLEVGSLESSFQPQLIIDYVVLTPEPTSISLALIGVALAGLRFARRRLVASNG